MLQIVDFNKQLEDEIEKLEDECIEISKRLEQCYYFTFKKYGVRIIIDLVRNHKGKNVTEPNVFDENYESYIEIALEDNDDYYPNAYIPIWKCKKELLYPIGYMTKWDTKIIEKKIKLILQDMLQERMEEFRNKRC